jgi:hypothetical protein
VFESPASQKFQLDRPEVLVQELYGRSGHFCLLVRKSELSAHSVGGPASGGLHMRIRGGEAAPARGVAWAAALEKGPHHAERDHVDLVWGDVENLVLASQRQAPDPKLDAGAVGKVHAVIAVGGTRDVG